MRFVNDYQVPWHRLNFLGLAAGELVGGDKHAGRIKRVAGTIFDGLLEGFSLQYRSSNAELVSQFLMPLLAQIGRSDHENTTLALRPTLGNEQAGLNGFAEANLIGKDGPL